MYNPLPDNDPQFRYPLQCVFLKLNASWPLRFDSRKETTLGNRDNLIHVAYKLWSWYIILSVAITCGFQSAFLVNIFGDIMQTTENCCTTLMGMLNLIRLLHLRLNQDHFRRIMRQFVTHIWIAKGSQPEIEWRCQRKMKVFRLMTIATSGLIVMYVTMPLAAYYQLASDERGDKPFPYKMLFPFDAQSNWMYVITYGFTSLAGVCVITTLFAEDSLFGFYVVYTCGQFELLHQQLRSLIQDSFRNTTKLVVVHDSKPFLLEFQRQCIMSLNRIAYKHQQLIQFALSLERFFSGVLLCNFLVSSVLICMVGFQLMTGKDMFIGDLLKLLLYISSSFSQLGVLCWQGDALIHQSIATSTALYACNWEGVTGYEKMSNYWHVLRQQVERPHNKLKPNNPIAHVLGKNFGIHVQFMIMCSQRPLKITAFKFSTLSLQSFTAIISTSMSYFTLLQSLYKKMETPQ